MCWPFLAADAALWIAARFDVPRIPARRRLDDPNRRRYTSGYEHGLGFLIRSGLWSTLSDATHAIVPALLELADRGGPLNDEFTIQISYMGIARHSGIKSPNSIRSALVALSDIGFLKLPDTPPRRSPERATATYVITPHSNQVWESAQALAGQRQTEIAAEVELRRRLRKERVQFLKDRGKQGPVR